MDDRRSGTTGRDADARVSRRDFLERATTVGLGIGAVLSGGLWVPRADAAGLAGHGALGADDPLLQATGTQRAQTLMLSNAAIAAQWSVDAGRLHFQRAVFSPELVAECDVVVAPLAYVGDRSVLRRTGRGRLLLVHEWLWQRSSRHSAVISCLLLKRRSLLGEPRSED